MGQDLISLQRINSAHPKLRCELRTIYDEANNHLGKSRLRFSFVLRTFAEQTALFAQGRTRPGSKVTNAKAGLDLHSIHFHVNVE